MRNLLLGAGLLAAVLAGVIARDEPPAPRPADAPPGVFSAERARTYLEELLGEGAPRPVGGQADARAVERIVQRLRALGYTPTFQNDFYCGSYGMCGHVQNVLARLEGGSGKAVLLVAHHDSVAAGPGASDDASSVAAVLEIARALRAGPSLPRPVIFLLDDGEENGLLGASAFASRHPWAQEVGAVVNLEARGTSGPSLLFETSGPSGWLPPLFRSMPHPRTSSLFATAYARLPNDTDLTVFKALGLPGVNFAFVDHAERYHTSQDDLAHVSDASLQHQGENALAMVRAFARADLERPRHGDADAVFFDVLGWTVLAWPVRAGLPLAALACVCTLVAIARMFRRGELRWKALAAGFAAFAGSALAAAAMGLVLRLLAVGPALEAGLYDPQPPAYVVATWLAPLTTAATAAALCRRVAPVAMWGGAALGWALLAGLTSAALPGSGYLFQVPSLALGLTGLAWAFSPSCRACAAAAALAPAATAALLVFPVAWILPSGIGSLAAPLSAGLVALVVVCLAPLAVPEIAHARASALLLAAGFLASGAAGVGAFRRPSEQRISMVFHEEGGRARWLVETSRGLLPPSARNLWPFARARTGILPGVASRRAFEAAAVPQGLPPPTLTVLCRDRLPDGRTRLRARLSSARGAPVLLMAVPAAASVSSASIGGVPVPQPPARLVRFLGGWRPLGCVTVPPGGVDLELEWEATKPIDAVLLDRSQGLPRAGASLAKALAAQVQSDGNETVVSTWVRL